MRITMILAVLVLASPALAGEKVAISGRGYTGVADVNADGTGTFLVGQSTDANRPNRVKGKFSGAQPTSKTITYSFTGGFAGRNAAVRGNSRVANPGYTPPAPPTPPTPPTPPSCGGDKGSESRSQGKVSRN